jgi:lipopolysaccharide assembly outer membrane protein LptD (OstA)
LLKQNGIAFFVALFCFFAVPAAFSVDDVKPAPQEVKSEEPAEKTVKTAKRDLPVKDIFDTGTARVEAVADSLEYSKETGKMIARGNAVITYQGTRILADYGEVDTAAKKAYAKGHVMIFKGDTPTIQGEEIYYDFENHTGNFPNARAINAPWYAKGKDIQQVREGVDKIKDGRVTTCNLEKPHYEIRGKRATLYANQKLVIYGATIYVLGKPVFWLPYLNIPLNWPDIPFQVTQGYNRKDGVKLGISKGFAVNKNIYLKAMLDWRQKRGVGGGAKISYDYEKWAKGNVKLYWTQDKKAPSVNYVNSNGVSMFQEPGGTFVGPFDHLQDRKHGRGEITWRHRTDLDDKTVTLLRYHRVADEYFLQEFFEDEYRSNIQPTSFITTTRNSERYGAMVHLEKKMNAYESMVTRLPEVRLDWKNQPFFFTDKVFNESRAQFDALATRYNRSSYHQNTKRFDVYSRFFVPLKWEDVSLTPYGGYRMTTYSKDLTSNSTHVRNIAEYGADLRTHFYKTYPVSFDTLGIEVNHLRHIFEPSVAFQGTSSSLHYSKLAHFDTIDRLDDAAKLIFGLENRLQTKRVVNGKTQRVDIVSFNTFLFYDMRPQYENPHMKGARFTIWENRLVLRPYEWLQLQTRVQFDFASHYLKRTDQDIILRKGKWRFLFGYSQVHDYYDYITNLAINKSQQFIIDGRYKFNHLWSAGGYIRWDTSDRNRLNNIEWGPDTNNSQVGNQGYGIQEWEVSATRDLHDFILEFGLNQRHSLVNSANSNKNKMNSTAFVKFSMKGVPFNVGTGGGQAPFCAPRIGETVAGSNESGGFFDAPLTTGGDSHSLTMGR